MNLTETIKKLTSDNLRLKKVPLFGWESGIKTTNPDVLNFYNNNNEFYAVKVNNKIHFFTTDGELGLVTSSIKNIYKADKYRKVETQNTVYHLIIIGDGFKNDIISVSETSDNFENTECKFAHITDIKELTRELFSEYPYASYGSLGSAYGDAWRDKFITEEQYTNASKFYGRLWDYVGD